MTLPNGAMVMAPPPMDVTFAEDYPGADIRLVNERWPLRILICGSLISLAKRGHTRCLSFDRRPSGHFVFPLVARISLLNASATYREVFDRPTDGDVYEFECVQSSRDLVR